MAPALRQVADRSASARRLVHVRAIVGAGSRSWYPSGVTDPQAPTASTPARQLPWDLHPALSEERLRICARLLAHARRDALAMATYELGDDAWSAGCRAYAFGRHRLARAANSGQYNWLGVLDESNAFVFLIEDVPVRFYRGLADEPTVRALRRYAVEAQQLSLALGEGAEDLAFRLAVETGDRGQVERVVFLALRGEEGEATCVWPVPLDVPSAVQSMPSIQLRLLPDDADGGPPSKTGPRRDQVRPAARVPDRQSSADEVGLPECQGAAVDDRC
jgi:hypothetical protein